MTPRISLVAVCCSNASLSSWNSRTFSMATTAWSAKVFTSSICRSLNGSTTSRQIVKTPMGYPHAEEPERRGPFELRSESTSGDVPLGHPDHGSAFALGTHDQTYSRREGGQGLGMQRVARATLRMRRPSGEIPHHIGVCDPAWAPASFTALSVTASSTGCSSVGEPAITRNTSLVAVCCSSDSRNSALRFASVLE